jgi:2-methylisocitrate lyase-like PEP mutase family enzyme
MSRQARRLSDQIAKGQPVIAPGVFDGLSARLVEQAGFDAVYASGGAIARSHGIPDLGLLSYADVLERLRSITDVVSMPVIADADTGYGNSINVARTVKGFVQAGVAALHLEDQVFPKRCGHLNDKSLVSTDEMVQKLKAARDAAPAEDLILIARTDAIAVEGFDNALERAHQYLAAGADMIFVEAPQTVKQIETIGQSIKAPKLINMFAGGKTPMVPIEQLSDWGYQVVIIPSDLQRAAIFAMQQTLEAIKADGDSQSLQDKMVSFADREQIIRTKDYLALDNKK